MKTTCKNRCACYIDHKKIVQDFVYFKFASFLNLKYFSKVNISLKKYSYVPTSTTSVCYVIYRHHIIVLCIYGFVHVFIIYLIKYTLLQCTFTIPFHFMHGNFVVAMKVLTVMLSSYGFQIKLCAKLIQYKKIF